MSDLALDVQDQKNLEATQNEPISFTPTWEQVAQFTKQADEMNLRKMIQDDIMKNRDPNDQVETVERTDPTEVMEVERRECYGLN